MSKLLTHRRPVRTANVDPRMVTFLFENTLNEVVTWKNIHSQRWQQPLEWQTIVCKPGRFIQLPHSYYEVHSASGRPIPVLRHLGRKMDQIKRDKPEFIDFTP